MVVALAVMCLPCMAAWAAEIVPSSYTAPPGEVGAYTYYDDTGSQLTDGLHGAPWSGEPGWAGDDPYPWVAWDSHPVTITFYFDRVCTLSSIQVFTGRSDGPSMFMPNRITLAMGSTQSDLTVRGAWTFENSDYSDACRHTLTMDVGAQAGTVAQLTIEPTARWIFLDEVDFYDQPVPEPSGLLALLCSLGGLGGMVWYRTREHTR